MFEITKTILAPGTYRFALAVGSIGLLLLFGVGARRRAGMIVLAMLAVAYFVAALPWTATRMSAGLIRADRVDSVSDARHAVAVVVLSGDSEDARIVETLRLVALLHPHWVVVSGPEWMPDRLVRAGVPAERIVHEPLGRTTREQTLRIGSLLRSRGVGPVVLVVSAIHMSRALATFRRAGIDTIPSVSATRIVAGAPRFWPLRDALRLSRESLYEHVALAYYRWRGWIGQAEMEG